MIWKLLSVWLLSVSLQTSGRVPSVEAVAPFVSVFDVKQEKVVKVLPLTDRLQKQVLEMLQASPELFAGSSLPADKSRLVLHIPFASPVQVHNPLYPAQINEVYLFAEPRQKPKALILFHAKRSILVVLNCNLEKFMEDNDLNVRT
ncbi:hypothetical protein [Cohnella thermotolerans]|uniref:hypothetical protein n=1 Tax=Cohnella thermotolerans TaxID=329858 RepID=UPI000410631C|nr:hypothetical protein [Cohnella thermotolerans]